MIDILRSQLLALRAQIDAMLLVIGSIESPAEPAAASCPHLETENIGTFGAPDFRCTMCRASVSPG